ncbi:hypothetical protein WJM93_15670 [Lactiplantibacillus plantarum]|uniref:hypothetical protein n=1 Tax=Lactiplantibacillus plantarum TaxID=1590 RepID=UPI0030AF16B9
MSNELGYSIKLQIDELPTSMMSRLPKAQAQIVLDYEKQLRSKKSKLLRKLGSENQIALQETERNVVGHSKSGYIPTGNLMRSIITEYSPDGVDILATAQSKGGYYYGNAVEFGTKRMHATPYVRPTFENMVAENEETAKRELI